MNTKVKLEVMIGKATVVVLDNRGGNGDVSDGGTAEEVNGLRAEMIKTLPPLLVIISHYIVLRNSIPGWYILIVEQFP